jgi:adenosylmethionine-8-amino-7-oxononanoate aminotransferase
MPGVAEVRRRGFMCGIELAGFELSDRAGHQVTLAARRRGAIVRPLGDVVVLMPPLAITTRELRKLMSIVSDSIAEVCASAEPARLAA